MSSKSTGQIRLANGIDRTSVLYNTYQLFVQTATLYANFAEHSKSPNIYERLAEDVIRDLGTLYSAWESIGQNSNSPVKDGAHVAVLVAHSSDQIAKVTTFTNEWTPMFRRFSLGILAEKRMSRILSVLMCDAGKEKETLLQLIARSTQRRDDLGAALLALKKDARKIQGAFSAADSTLIDKSFGF